MKLICNAADKCGFECSLHSKPHDSYGLLCAESVPCATWQRYCAGIGEKKSKCWCIPVEEKEQ